MEGLDHATAGIRQIMEAKNAAREVALRQCRDVIRLASRSIRAIHRLEIPDARVIIDEARLSVSATREALAGYPDLYWAGYVHDSQKEYVEAEVVLAIVQGATVPDHDSLGVEPAAYLNGLAEAGSECRRFVLDRLREGNGERAEGVLAAMEEIYYELISFDFPDAITGGLRRTTDAFRAVLERTRADLTLTMQQQALLRVIRDSRVIVTSADAGE